MQWEGFLFGFLGSIHCLGMCGPIALLLPINKKEPFWGILQLLQYHLGRILIYCAIGLGVGFFATQLDLFRFQQQLAIITGISLLVFVFLPQLWRSLQFANRPLQRLLRPIKNSLGKQLQQKKQHYLFFMGLLNGLLPCGFVSLAVLRSLGLPHWQDSVGFMFFFGLGTAPLLSLLVFGREWMPPKARLQLQRWLPVFIVLLGILFILRGMELNIPFVSPAPITPNNPTMHCH